MARLQNLPHLGTSEEDVLFVEWLTDEGAAVEAGAVIATVETLKAAFDVEADGAGVLLKRLCAAGERVGAQAPIAVFGDDGEACDDACLAALLAAHAATAAKAGVPQATAHAPQPRPRVAPEPFTAGDARQQVAPAARRRAAELGVDLTSVVGSGAGGLVRVADVDRAHAAAADPVPAAATGAARGRVDPAFLAEVRRDPVAFAALRSDFKLMLYRRHGAEIGPDCRLGAGSVLLVDDLVLGAGAFIGPDCTIEARQLTAGPLLHFGARCRVRCTRLVFGENAFFTDDVEIGGGGAMDPEAELVVGSHGFVGEHVHLNPCRRLALGDEVVLSRNAVLMTHSFGPSWLRGYASRFAGVTVGDGAQIGIAVTLFPGVDVGAGSVVLSGSSVVTSVPPGRLVGGVPAVDIKAAAQSLSPEQVAERAGVLVREFARQLDLRGLEVAVHDQAGHCTLVVARDDGEHRLVFAPTEVDGLAAFAAPAGIAETVLVAMAMADEVMAALPECTTAIALEPPRVAGRLGPLAAAFREFLRKRGVRLHPRAWAYTGGWL